jgi:hypothetical protein
MSEPHEYGDDLRELGKKQRAGRALSEMLRAIGTEIDQVYLPDDPGPNPGPPRIISKAERMARHIWMKALPHKDDEGIQHEPDLDYIKIVLDRVEGKPGSGDKKDDGPTESLPDKISRMNATRINDLAEEVVSDSDIGETETGNSISE